MALDTFASYTPRWRRYHAERVSGGGWVVLDRASGGVARDDVGRSAYFAGRTAARSFACDAERVVPWSQEDILRLIGDRFWPQVDRPDEGCWEWAGFCEPIFGYGRCQVGDEQLAHRVSWLLTFGPIPEGLCVCHRCDNPPCVRPDHLFLGTQTENMRDMATKGRWVGHDNAGERHPLHKLTESAVRTIRIRHAEGAATQASLAREFGVTPGAIQFIVTRQRWKNVA